MMTTILLIIIYILMMNKLGKRFQRDHTKNMLDETREVPIPVDVPVCSNISQGAKLSLFDYYVYYYRVEHLMM